MASTGARYRYESRHPVTGELIDGNLRLIGPKWSRLVADNGQMSANVAAPDPLSAGGAQRLDRLRRSVEPLASAWYVKNADTGQYVWGGPVVAQDWDPRSQVTTVRAVEWRAWLYKVPLTPYEDTGRDYLYRWAGVDQIQIAREIADLVVTDTFGSPQMLFTPYTASGKTRDFQVYGSELKSAGELLDSIARRDGGFEWSIEIVDDAGVPKPQFTTWHPWRGSNQVSLSLRSDTAEGKSNLMAYGPVQRSGEERYARFWATGSGQAPDMINAAATDPALASGSILRFEGSAAYSSVVKRETLAEYARAGVRFYSGGLDTMKVTVPIGKPDVDTYEVGDRTQLRIKDRWLDISLPAARILSREVDPTAGSVDLLLDLSDAELPQVEA